MYAGFDFGTTNSECALINLNGSTTYRVFKDGSPSLFIYSSNECRELCGNDCMKSMAAIDYPEDIIRSIKTRIRKSPQAMEESVTSGGKQFKVRDIVYRLVAQNLIEMRKQAKDMSEIENSLLDGLTITAPIGIASGKLTATDYNQFLKDIAVEVTGLSEDKVHVIEEPIAAAFGYLYKDGIRKQYDNTQKIMVFDLGGGTLDVTIVEYVPATRTYTVLAKEGDLNLGGNNFSSKLEMLIASKCGVNINKLTPSEAVRFADAVNKCKHRLSDEDESNISFEYEGKRVREFITREEFEATTTDLLDKAMALAKKTVKNLEGGVMSLDMIVLVGGASQMPQIRRGLIGTFPKFDQSKILIDDPFVAIARGAAIYSQIEGSGRETGSEITIEDTATHTYGFDSKIEGSDELKIYNLIFKDTKYTESIKVKAPSTFHATTNDQDKIVFNVYESDKKIDDCFDGHWCSIGDDKPNGMVVSVNVPTKYIGRAREYYLNVEFCLHKGCILEMIITDMDDNRVGYCKQ